MNKIFELTTIIVIFVRFMACFHLNQFHLTVMAPDGVFPLTRHNNDTYGQ